MPLSYRIPFISLLILLLGIAPPVMAKELGFVTTSSYTDELARRQAALAAYREKLGAEPSAPSPSPPPSSSNTNTLATLKLYSEEAGELLTVETSPEAVEDILRANSESDATAIVHIHDAHPDVTVQNSGPLRYLFDEDLFNPSSYATTQKRMIGPSLKLLLSTGALYTGNDGSLIFDPKAWKMLKWWTVLVIWCNGEYVSVAGTLLGLDALQKITVLRAKSSDKDVQSELRTLMKIFRRYSVTDIRLGSYEDDTIPSLIEALIKVHRETREPLKFYVTLPTQEEYQLDDVPVIKLKSDISNLFSSHLFTSFRELETELVRGDGKMCKLTFHQGVVIPEESTLLKVVSEASEGQTFTQDTAHGKTGNLRGQKLYTKSTYAHLDVGNKASRKRKTNKASRKRKTNKASRKRKTNKASRKRKTDKASNKKKQHRRME